MPGVGRIRDPFHPRLVRAAIVPRVIATASPRAHAHTSPGVAVGSRCLFVHYGDRCYRALINRTGHFAAKYATRSAWHGLPRNNTVRRSEHPARSAAWTAARKFISFTPITVDRQFDDMRKNCTVVNRDWSTWRGRELSVRFPGKSRDFEISYSAERWRLR